MRFASSVAVPGLYKGVIDYLGPLADPVKAALVQCVSGSTGE